jgi:hypothetical protein
VQVEGQPVAIRGASVGSMGDIASKATGGGVVSATTHGPTKFMGPGSFDVKIEGKNVQLLADPTLNNCGGPANSATMAGTIQGATDDDEGGSRPPNLSPEGAMRRGAFNAAKKRNGVPRTQQPKAVRPNVDKRGKPQPGRMYEFEVRDSGGGTREVIIRDDAKGHFFGPGDRQNRGPHFNDEAKNHYDY